MTVQPQKKETVVPGCGISGFNEFVYAWESQHCTNVRAINLTNRSKRISRGTVHKWTLPKSVTRIAAGQECLAYAKEQRVHVIEYGKKAARRRAHWKSDKLPSDPTALCWQKGKLVAWSDQGARTEFSPPLKR